MDAQALQLRAWRDRAEQAEEELKQLRAAMAGPQVWTFPREWRLSISETAMLSSLFNSPDGTRTKEALFAVSATHSFVDPKVVQVRICKMRQKLAQFGIEIETLWSHGYELPAASKAIIRQALADRSAA